MSSTSGGDEFTSPIISSDHTERDDKQSDMLKFSGMSHFCAVSVIDIVNSTKITAKIAPSKLGKFYSIFLNSVANIVKDNGGVVVKNIGDSLLYYFAVCNTTDSCISDAFRCNLQIIEKRNKINDCLVENGLPRLNYRISSDYGKVFVAMSAISSIDDIFGPAVNMCAKINHVGESNRFFVGHDLYVHAKSVVGFKFDEIDKEKLDGFKFDYPVYYVDNSL